MLDPNQRALYADSLRPPLGRVFDQGLATTYSLGLDTLLTIPLQLALFDRRNADEMLSDGVAVLEALRRTSARLSIYCQQGQIHVPAADHVLFGMLEPIVHEVRAPGGGAFHAKVWVLRYVDPIGEKNPCIRLVVLTRNLTFDRSWDLSLLLEGSLMKGVQRSSRVMAKFVRALPELSNRPVPFQARDRAKLLGDEVARTRFEVPEDFEELSFHVHGLGGRRWRPNDSTELAVISPFCDDTAIADLVSGTRDPIALVSRSETLEALSDESLAHFSKVLVLDDAAETEDGEDTTESGETLRGLHAKAYFSKTGWDTRVALGSANATRSGLLNGRNVEVVAELVGKGSRVGKIEDLLGKDGFGDVLTEYVRPTEPPAIDPSLHEAELALDQARLAITEAGLKVRCSREARNDAWNLALRPKVRFDLAGIQSLRAWPITVASAHAVDATELANGSAVPLCSCALASITGLIAFELTSTAADQRARFVLNLPLVGLPEGRDAAIMQTVISNQDGFLRYLALLLSDLGEDPFAPGIEVVGSGWGDFGGTGGSDDIAILEHLVRAFSREPERLRAIQEIIERLRETEETGVMPPGFSALWRSFEIAMGKDS